MFVVAGSTGAIAEQLLESPEYLHGAMAWQMFADGELDAIVMDGVSAAQEAGDTLSDALWADMLGQAGARLGSMDHDDRQAFARATASTFVEDLGLVNGVIAQLSGFDLLWLFLALGTAFRMMDAPTREPELEPVVAETREGGS